MPLRHNFGNSGMPPAAVTSVPEEVLPSAQGRSAAAAGDHKGRPLVPLIRRPLLATAAGDAPSDGFTSSNTSSGPGFGTGAYSTLHAGGTPAMTGFAAAAAPPGPPKKLQSQVGLTNGNVAAPNGPYQQREPKKPPPAPSSGAKDVDFGTMSVKGTRGYRFSLKSGTWGDTAVKHVSLDPEAAPLETKLPWQGRPWYANLRPLAIPVVAAYAIVCVVYVVIRALKSVDAIASPAYGKVVLAFEALGMVSLLQAGINHLYKVDWTTQPFMGSRDPRYRVRVLVPCYKEDVEVLRKTLTRAVRALHEGAACISEAHVYLCDDAPKGVSAEKDGPSFRDERSSMMGLGSDSAPQSVRGLARGDPASPLHHKVTLHHQPRYKGNGPTDEGLVNNKANNINHCVERMSKEWTSKTGRPFNDDGLEIFAILDADQAIVDKAEDKEILEEVVEVPMRPSKTLAFFKDLLPYFVPDPKVAIVQTPQVFKGCLLGTDILNHRNIDFWSHQQPAYNLRNFISCAGTNFLIRASAFLEAGGFPGHTLTEDFALGQELMGCGYYGVYVEKAYVLGEAPDVLRTAVGQRSRWCKGAFQMLISVRGMRSLFRLKNPRLIWMYIFPCYNYTVSGLSTPLFMAIPIVYVFAGLFPALLSAQVIGIATAYFILTLMVQYFPRFDRRRVGPDLLAHWNADVATKNFWFMFIKSALRGPLVKCNEGASAWKSGSDKEKDGWHDVLPHIAFLVAYLITIVWAILELAAGVVFRGPMGISLLWCFFQAIPPFLLVLHRCMKIRHEVEEADQMDPKELEAAERAWRFQHTVYTVINVSLMLASAVIAIAILVLASVTVKDLKVDSSTVYSGKTSTGYLTPSELVKSFRGEGLPARFTAGAA